ncbi:protein LURP-one-related 17 [Prosopis cineraria]|uniref:protein LURP-one-related 17 n=1 Tax=Prosopis cineraria TaxID=364024 RepID=UPI002410B665|nr:protein LURP-one-related 17 [Prosopis cineraria]
MRMFPKFKSLSRAVHEERDSEQEKKAYPRTEGTPCSSLTVWRKSLVISCEGFTVIDSDGNLVYRVDNYIERPEEVVLMDGAGKSVLTMRRRRKLGLGDCWFIYEGEVGDCRLRNGSAESPIFRVRRRVNILQGNPNVQATVYRGTSDKRHAFSIEGSYARRTCKVLDESKEVVAEIKRKEASSKNVSFGIDVFQLIVQPGFDAGFAMALVLLLDQMFS